MSDIVTPTQAAWDAFVAAQPRAHVLQLWNWGEVKRAYGWGVERLAIERDGQIVAGTQLLFRTLPMRFGTMAYLPFGPYTGDDDAPDLWRAIHQTAKQRNAAFLKWEPGIYAPDEPQPELAERGFRVSPQVIQPPNTVLIDVGADEDTILARMNQGTRRKIRQSLKNDIHYYEATSKADVGKFVSMMQTTGARNGFGVHEPAYYERAFDLFVPQRAALIMAEHDGDPLAGVMVFAVGPSAWYLFGASSNIKRNLMAAYGVQWHAIQWAKARGCTVYDMFGIPDVSEATLEAQFESRSDGLWGVYGFKRGWGGRVTRSLGAWDLPYFGLLYEAYRIALQVRDRRGVAGA
jgi:peptidoglycan pentaglycine glycine transferase (the first glycine)